jgi:hypothetical protein
MCGAALMVIIPKVLGHDSHPRCLDLLRLGPPLISAIRTTDKGMKVLLANGIRNSQLDLRRKGRGYKVSM